MGWQVMYLSKNRAVAMTTDLASLLNGLGNRAVDHARDSFIGTPIPATKHHVARDYLARPVILLRALRSDIRPATIVLENLRIEHDVHCSITSERNEKIDDRFTVVQCLAEDEVLQRYFLDLCDALLTKLPLTPSQRDIADRFDQIAMLFRVLEEPSRQSVQGVWGELFLILASVEPIGMIQAWHDDTNERYDFSVGGYRMEVKTSSTRTRRHHFSFEQANPEPGVNCVIVSLFVEPSTGGRTLGSLWDEVRAYATHDSRLRSRIDQVVLGSLGNQWRLAREKAFDEQLASSSMAYFDVHQIPRISKLPSGVSEVRFCSDLAAVIPLSEAQRQAKSLPGHSVIRHST